MDLTITCGSGFFSWQSHGPVVPVGPIGPYWSYWDWHFLVEQVVGMGGEGVGWWFKVGSGFEVLARFRVVFRNIGILWLATG